MERNLAYPHTDRNVFLHVCSLCCLVKVKPLVAHLATCTKSCVQSLVLSPVGAFLGGRSRRIRISSHHPGPCGEFEASKSYIRHWLKQQQQKNQTKFLIYFSKFSVYSYTLSSKRATSAVFNVWPTCWAVFCGLYIANHSLAGYGGFTACIVCTLNYLISNIWRMGHN